MSRRNEHSVANGVEGKICSTCRRWTPLVQFSTGHDARAIGCWGLAEYVRISKRVRN